MRQETLAKALLFFSGVAALIYQAIWIKQLTLVVGVDVYAITTGISGFFAGLAVGSAVFGRLADRLINPLRVYVALELGIAVLGVASTIALAHAAPIFVAMQSSVGPLAWIVPFALVAVPAALMGETLPPLLAALRPEPGTIGRLTGQLYASNTGGAIVGALLTILAVVPAFGIRGASMFAASINLALAAAAILVLAGRRGHKARQRTRSKPVVKTSSDARLALALYAIAGGIALGYEVVWAQVIVQFLSTRAIAFSVVLATYLFGLVVGSSVYARRADRITRPWFAFGVLIAGAGVAALATFALLGAWLPQAQIAFGTALGGATGNFTIEMCARFALAAGFVVLPSTLLLGAAFPAAAKLIVKSDRVGTGVGLILAVNTGVGILGTLVTGFVLIPLLGLAGSLGVLAVVAAAVGGIAIAHQTGAIRWAPQWAAVLVLVVVGFAVSLPRDRLATLLVDAEGGELIFYDESPGGTVAVIEHTPSRGSFRRLYIRGVSNADDGMPSLRYMRLQALLPLVTHAAEPKSAMVIALGTGITAGSLLADPSLERRLCVELLSSVVEAVPLFDGNFDAGIDPNLEIVKADGRHELMRREETFDLITLEPPPPAAAGVVNLYSRDFYELARQRLTKSGVLAQWWPISTHNDEDSQSLVRSMLDVFPHVALWTTSAHEMMVVGSMAPMPLDYERIAQRLATPSIAQALREVGITSPADLLATYVTDRAGLEAYVGDAPPVTDDRPRIEYSGWVRPGEFARLLPKVLALRKPPPVAATPDQKARIEASYRHLEDFYMTTLLFQVGDQQAWRTGADEFARNNEPNVYYDWFIRRYASSAN